MTFGEGVRRLAEVPGGEIYISDYYPTDGSRSPYRFAQLSVRFFPSDGAIERAAELMAVAVETGGYMTVNVHADEVAVQISLSRPLEESELRTPGAMSLPVSLDEAVRA